MNNYNLQGSMPLDEILYKYRNLIFKVSSRCETLETLYREHLVCKPGCSQCCRVERTVLSIEGYIIERYLQKFSPQRIKRLRRLYKDSDETCPMLLKDRCVIYPVRPIICRTHGLPILYEEAGRAFIDYCRLNFTRLPLHYEFAEQDVLDMNPFNLELIELDRYFVEEVTHQPWHPKNRRSLKTILFHLDLRERQTNNSIIDELRSFYR